MQLRDKIETGIVHEQAVSIEEEQGRPVRLRRVELHTARPTKDGDTVIRLSTDLPVSEFTVHSVAHLYRHRWRIESLFQRLEAVLYSEVHSLGHPHGAKPSVLKGYVSGAIARRHVATARVLKDGFITHCRGTLKFQVLADLA